MKHTWFSGAASSAASQKQTLGTFFSKEECDVITRAKSSSSGISSRTDSMGSLLELFSNEGVSRS